MNKTVCILIILLGFLLSACSAPPERFGAEDTPQAPSPEPPPTVGPDQAPSPDTDIEYRAAEILNSMTAREKICQMLIIRIDDVTGRKNETEYGEAFRQGLENYPVGGIVFFTENIASSEQVRGMIAAAREASEIPPFVSADEEGGRVRRLSRKLDTEFFDAMFSYRSQGEGRAYDNAKQIAADMTAHLFNLNFAPVADIWTNPKNTVIGDRAYSDTAGEAARLVASAVRGFLDGGIIPTLKHFPGHGDTYQDTHDGPAFSDATLEALREREFLPFISGIEAGAPVVMLSHVTMTQIDPEVPSTFSSVVISDLLRGELGFDGVITTDSLAMGALSDYTSGEIAVRAISAGCDILLGIKDIPEAVEAISSEIPESRIDASVLRILTLKLEYDIIE